MVNLSKKFGLTDWAYFHVGIGTNESFFGGPINGRISDYVFLKKIKRYVSTKVTT